MQVNLVACILRSCLLFWEISTQILSMVTVTIKRFANYWSMCVFILPSGSMIGFLAVKVENPRNREILHTGGILPKTRQHGVYESITCSRLGNLKFCVAEFSGPTPMKQRQLGSNQVLIIVSSGST